MPEAGGQRPEARGQGAGVRRQGSGGGWPRSLTWVTGCSMGTGTSDAYDSTADIHAARGDAHDRTAPATARRGLGGPVRRSGARLRAPGIPEQDRARAQQRRGREAAARADPGLLRLLRLALLGARALAARAAGPPLSRRALRAAGARGARREPDAGAHRRRGALPRGLRPHVVRAALRPGVAAAARGRAARVERPAGAAVVARAGAARAGGRRAHRGRGCPSSPRPSASASTRRRPSPSA